MKQVSVKYRIAALAGLVGAILSPARNACGQQFTLQESSQPPGIIATQSGSYVSGALVQTVDAPPTASGYGFASWTINGQPAVGLTGQALNEASFLIGSDTTAVALYLSLSQDTNHNGIPDYLELYYYGSTANSPTSDTDGDGFTFQQELARGYNPTIPDITASGGAILRLSDATTFVPGVNEYYYEIQSQPQAIISTSSGYVTSGTPVQTPDVSYGPTSGYYFGYWTINGIRQAGVTGAALTGVTLPMTNDETAVAVFFSPGDSTGSGLQDWYQWFWFGDTSETADSDPTGDGFTIADDVARGYSPVIPNVATAGGAILRLSDSSSILVFLAANFEMEVTAGQSGELPVAKLIAAATAPPGTVLTVSLPSDTSDFGGSLQLLIRQQHRLHFSPQKRTALRAG
jgi:hypothetical protein